MLLISYFINLHIAEVIDIGRYDFQNSVKGDRQLLHGDVQLSIAL